VAGGDIRRSVIRYMNNRKRFAFIQGTHVARDLGWGGREDKRKVKEDLNKLVRHGVLKKRTMRIRSQSKTHYSVVTYARVVAKIDEDTGSAPPNRE
jgi:hypothetical protein